MRPLSASELIMVCSQIKTRKRKLEVFIQANPIFEAGKSCLGTV